MIDEKKKMTAQESSVGADDVQSISKNSDISITTSKGEINDEVVNPQESLEEMYRRIQHMSDPAYLHTVTPVSYTHLTLPTTRLRCRSRWSPYH